MIYNFVAGGAAISVLSKRLNADFAVVNMGTVTPINDIDSPHFINHQLMLGTHDFSEQAAMSATTLQQALQAGRNSVVEPLADREPSNDKEFSTDKNNSPQLFIAGEMGIGNTSSASAIYSLLLSIAPEQSVGPGTGVDKEGLATKRKVIYRAFNQHGDALDSNKPLSVMQYVGGLEIAALVGAYIAAAQQSLPMLVDGFITTAAALLAVKLNPSVRNWMMFSHQSAEPAHQLALQHLNAKPLLNLGMRLGEGSGAATAVPLIQTALALHTQMATFNDAGVSDADA